jgi:hypothetical protein
MGRDQRGQATVELALCLPFVILLVALSVQISLVGVEQIRLWHAAREAVRIASVDGDVEAIRDAANGSGLRDLVLDVEPPEANRTQGGAVRVVLQHHPEAQIPLAGRFLSGVTLRAEATMRIEQP